MTGPLYALFQREIRIARRIGGGGLTGLMFFLILTVVTPFAIGPDLKLLAKIGPALLWLAALLATLLGLDRLLQGDEEDGSLDLLLMSDTPLELTIAVKCLAQWVVSALPLLLATPLFALLLGLDARTTLATMASFAVGTPALTFLGAVGAALTVSLRRGGLLLTVLVLPLTIPVLIFGVSAASAASAQDGAFTTTMFVLCGLSLAAMASAPFAAAAAVRLARQA
jgi:heme exporter protein B